MRALVQQTELVDLAIPRLTPAFGMLEGLVADGAEREEAGRALVSATFTARKPLVR